MTSEVCDWGHNSQVTPFHFESVHPVWPQIARETVGEMDILSHKALSSNKM